MKCSFCEAPLVCKNCAKPFHPKTGEGRVAAYQADMQVFCPECGKTLACRACGYVFGEDEEDEET